MATVTGWLNSIRTCRFESPVIDSSGLFLSDARVWAAINRQTDKDQPSIPRAVPFVDWVIMKRLPCALRQLPASLARHGRATEHKQDALAASSAG